MTTLNNIGTVYSDWRRYAQALEFYQKSLAIAKEIGDRTGEANSLGNIATSYYFPGEYTKALELYQQTLKITQEIGDRLFPF